MTSNDFAKHIAEMLKLGRETICGTPALVEETGDINTKGEKSIGMDIKMEDIFVDYARKNNLPVKIYSEEKGVIEIKENPTHWLVFDPLDGSTNYKIGKGLFPYGSLIAVYEGLKPKLKDIVAAGASEYTHDLSWVYQEGKTFDLLGKQVSLQDWPIDKRTPMVVDLCRNDDYGAYKVLVGKLNLHNYDSTAGHLVYVLANTASALSYSHVKAEEIGAVYALIKGAGGLAVDHQGRDLGERELVPGETYETLAGSKNIVEFVLSKFSQKK